MHTATSARIGDDGRTAILEQAGKELRAEILSPENARFQLIDAQPLPSSPHPERQAKNEHIRKLAIHLSGITDSRIAVLLAPKPSKDETTSQAAKLSGLSAW